MVARLKLSNRFVQSMRGVDTPFGTPSPPTPLPEGRGERGGAECDVSPPFPTSAKDARRDIGRGQAVGQGNGAGARIQPCRAVDQSKQGKAARTVHQFRAAVWGCQHHHAPRFGGAGSRPARSVPAVRPSNE